MKKSKHRFKLKEYGQGTQQVQAVSGIPLARKAVYKPQGSEGVATGAIEAGAKAVPVIGAFAAVGKAGYKVARNEDEYGVASSNAGAGAASALAPHKAVLRFADKGQWGKAGIAALNPIAGGIMERQEDMKLRALAIQKEEFDANVAKYGAQDETTMQTGQVYKDGTSEIKTYRLGGKDYTGQDLVKTYGPNDGNLSTYRAQPEQIYRQQLEYSTNPEDLKIRDSFIATEDAQVNADALKYQAQLAAQKQAFIVQNQNILTPTQTKSVAESTGVMKTKPKLKYKDGGNLENTKPIEVEKDELHFRKVGSNYKLVADHKGGETHAQGGIDVIAKSGDSIIPGKDRSKILKMVGKNGIISNKEKFNSYRMKLPKDAPVAKNGSDLTPMKPRGGDYGGITQPGAPSANIQPITNSNGSLPTGSAGEAGGGSNMGSYLNTAMQIAPIAYNLGQGLLGKVDKESANYVNPDLIKYEDISDPLRRKSREIMGINASNARNLGGGNTGNVRANLNQSAAEDFERQQQINQAEVSRALDIKNTNVGITNNSKFYNAEETGRVNNVNAQNKAKKSEYLAKGLEGVQNYALTEQQNKSVRDQNNMLAGLAETDSYKYDPSTKKWVSKAKKNR